jgi:hypothetical protein
VVRRRLLLAAVVAGCASTAAWGAPARADDDGRSELFRLTDQRITESSGLAISVRHRNMVFTHNDSGHPPEVFAVDTRTGNTTATLTLRGAPARDWEAMTECGGPDGPTLWVGDIGDNLAAWKTYRLLSVREPTELSTGDAPYTSFDYKYADGKARNAETLLCRPSDNRLFVVSKQDAGQAAVWQAPAQLRSDRVNVLTRVGAAPPIVTDGTFLPGSKHVILRGYYQAWVVEATTWRTVATFTPPIQIQGESVTALLDRSAVLFGSEGLNSAVWRVPLPADPVKLEGTGGPNPGDGEPTETPSATPRHSAHASAKPTHAVSAKPVGDSHGLPGIDGRWVALLSALGLGALVLTLATRRD